MTSSVDTQNREESASDTGLRQLVSRGFRFMQPSDSNGDPLALVGVRGHDNVIDVIRLESEDHVVAARMPGEEDNIFTPNTTWWKVTGSVCEVIDELLKLPDDHTPGSLLTA